MERYCSTGQSPQRAVAPTEEEEELNDVVPFAHVTQQPVRRQAVFSCECKTGVSLSGDCKMSALFEVASCVLVAR